MPRFTLKQMALATALIAAGTWGLSVVHNSRWDEWGEFTTPVGIAFGSYALIGAGIGVPFYRPVIGPAIGAFLGFVAATVWLFKQ
jgi:hypothetical protein